eukprot:COSAG02_NODE_130_length_34758_cov_80.817767_39_plen_70_part_00
MASGGRKPNLKKVCDVCSTLRFFKSKALAVFERYALFFLAETAPPRPLGPKGEVHLAGAGKTYRFGFAS